MENPNVSASQNIRQEENKTNLKELVPLAIVTSGIIGSVYGLLCYINPIIYISFLLIFGIRILLNVLLIAINDGSKGFEKILLIAIAVFICLFGWYCNWVAYISLEEGVNFFHSLINVSATMNSAINYSTHAQIAVGSLMRGSSTALGSVLFFAHVIEFAGFLLPIYDVFIKKCHLCDKCKKPMNKSTYFLGSKQELQIDTLHKGDFSVLSNLLVSDDITQLNGFVFIYKLTVYRCVDCQEMIAGLYEVEIYRSDNKIEENNSRAIIKEMPVDNKNRLIIERLISKV